MTGLAVHCDHVADMVERLGEEVVERLDAYDYGRQRGRNLRIGHVADVGFAVNNKVVNLGVEGALDLGCGAAEADGHSVVGDLRNREAMAGEPIGDGGDVCLGGAEVCADLLGRKPLMEVGRGLVILAGDELLERCLLRLVAAEDQDEVGHGEIWTHATAIVSDVRSRVRISFESYKIAFVDPIDDSYGGRKSLCGQSGGTKQCTCQYTEGERAEICHSGSFNPFLRRQPFRNRKVVIANKKTPLRKTFNGTAKPL